MKKDPHVKPSQQSPHFPNSFHRVSIKGIHVEDGKVLMGQDFVFETPAWELPGGGLDFGESIADALRREVKEEMGLEVNWIAPEPTYIWTLRRENAHGMEWWYAIVLAYRIDIKNLDELVPSDECRAIKFFSKEDLLTAKDISRQSKEFAKLFNPADFD